MGRFYREKMKALTLFSINSEVTQIILSMKVDGICNKILKFIIDDTVNPLVYCINLSLQNGVVPKKTKIAKIIPIFKSGDKDDLQQYRSI